MSRSHICVGCGHDLVRAHAPPDPSYGLPVVVCPVCALACVRRPCGGTGSWRATVRAWRAGARIFLRLMLLFLLLVTTIAATAGIADGLDFVIGRDSALGLLDARSRVRARLTDWVESADVWVAPAWVLVWSGAGFFLGLSFPHWRVRWWLAGLLATVAFVILVPGASAAVRNWADGEGLRWRGFIDGLPEWESVRFAVAPFAAGVALASGTMIPAARLGRTMPGRRGLRSRRLTRARKRRRDGR